MLLAFKFTNCGIEIESFTGISFYNDEKTVISVQANDKQIISISIYYSNILLSYIKVWDLRKIDEEKGKKKKKKAKNFGANNPYLMLRIDKTLAFQNKIFEVTNKITEFRKNENKTKEDIKALWYS